MSTLLSRNWPCGKCRKRTKILSIFLLEPKIPEVQHAQKYENLITELKKDFDHRFSNYRNSAMRFKMFFCPFSVTIEKVLNTCRWNLLIFSDRLIKKRSSTSFRCWNFTKIRVKRKISKDSQISCLLDFIIWHHLLVRTSFSCIATYSLPADFPKIVGEKQCQFSH